MSARVARFELPGKCWYFAVCPECLWIGLDWKHKKMALEQRDSHNELRHPTVSTNSKERKIKHELSNTDVGKSSHYDNHNDGSL